MEPVRDSLIDLERHRQRLEKTITELRQNLPYWRTCDAEYETLIEELGPCPPEPPQSELRAQLERIRSDWEGEVIGVKDLDEIFGKDASRSKENIILLTRRRIDYVTTGITQIEKQLADAENKHATASVISQPDLEDEEGQPITEIVEELDDDDNVLSYKLNQPGQSLPHVREALQQAGVKDLPETKAPSETGTSSEPAEATKSQITELPSLKELPIRPRATKGDRGAKSTSNESIPKKPAKKGVSFAQDTKDGDESEEEPISYNAERVESIMKIAKDQQEITKQKPVIPENEDSEDAAMRQEMLRYSMGEVGAVVAELEIEEGDFDDDEDWDYSDEGLDEFEDDDEDKYGRSTGRLVTDRYRERMLELEQKLGIKSRFTADLKSDPDKDAESESDDERIGRIVVNHNADETSSKPRQQPTKPAVRNAQSSEGPSKKGVRFAESLDIAPDKEPDSVPVAPAVNTRQEPLVEPLSDVMERSNTSKGAEANSTRKPSRFKRAREETGQAFELPKGPLDAPTRFMNEARGPIPTGPEGATLADQLVEHEMVSKPVDHDDEFDDEVDYSQLAEDHQRLRQKFIQRQGGFLKEDQSPIMPMEENPGAPQRQSRFKAARLSRQ